MKTISSHLLIAVSALAAACSPADINRPNGNSETPEQVEVTNVVNYSGRSVIYYNLPDDNNLKYVKAEFEPRPGIKSEVNASFYTDSLVLEGFSEERDYEVKLYSVSFSEKRSKPVVATVSPLLPPYRSVLEEMECVATFGGIQISFENPTKAHLTVTVSKKNEDGSLTELQTKYTSAPDVKFSVRGQESVPTEFVVSAKDHWGNMNTSKSVLITPIFEIMCDKTKFQKLMLQGDTYICHYWNTTTKQNDMLYCWDGEVSAEPRFQTRVTDVLPQHFTFDMGAKYKLSRFVYWGAKAPDGTQTYTFGHLRRFEIYGATELNPDPTVELFDNEGTLDPYWKLIGTYESTRPSGFTVSSSVEPLTDDDLAIMDNGEEYEVSLDAPEVRYVRVRTLETWGGVGYIQVGELSLYGALAE